MMEIVFKPNAAQLRMLEDIKKWHQSGRRFVIWKGRSVGMYSTLMSDPYFRRYYAKVVFAALDAVQEADRNWRKSLPEL